jgi:uncharacterized membrane protein (UPF0127 family)
MNLSELVVPAIVIVIVLAALAMLGKTPAKFCFGAKCFDGELADNPLKKALGLMFRDSIGEDCGMVFPMDGKISSFWMRNVKFPLELICVKGGKVVEIITMETCDAAKGCVHYAPKTGIDYAVEANVGFCSRNGIRAGTAFALQK